MRINTNVSAINAANNLSKVQNAVSMSMEKLSSGFRINSSGDDAAGLAIANKLRSEGRSLQQAGRNASQANSMLQIADGATNTVSTVLARLKELATQSNSDSIGTQRSKLDAEFQALVSEIGRIASTTQYQGSNLIDGTFGSSVTAAGSTVLAVANVTGATTSGAASGTYTITKVGAKLQMSNAAGTLTQQISDAAGAQTLNFSAFGIKVTTGAAYTGAETAVGNIVVGGSGGNFMVSSSGQYSGADLISLSAIDLTTGATGLNLAGLDLLSAANAQTALTRLDTALDNTNTAIGSIGAAESRINFASTNVATIAQNVTAAESTIRDADMAAETTQFTKFNILQQAGMAMISQANQSASQVLTLLR